MGKFNHIKILSTCDSIFKGKSRPLVVVKNLGMVDVTIYRRVFMQKGQVSLDLSSIANNKLISKAVENAI